MSSELVMVRSTVTEGERFEAAAREAAATPLVPIRPRRTIDAMRAIRHREITLGREMTETERDAWLVELCKRDSA